MPPIPWLDEFLRGRAVLVLTSILVACIFYLLLPIHQFPNSDTGRWVFTVAVFVFMLLISHGLQKFRNYRLTAKYYKLLAPDEWSRLEKVLKASSRIYEPESDGPLEDKGLLIIRKDSSGRKDIAHSKPTPSAIRFYRKGQWPEYLVSTVLAKRSVEQITSILSATAWNLPSGHTPTGVTPLKLLKFTIVPVVNELTKTFKPDLLRYGIIIL